MKSWASLEAASSFVRDLDLAGSKASAQARNRLFGRSIDDVRVVFYRDNHAWCPYCQKVWIYLEEKRIPYKVEKITMFCYGEKEKSYKRLVANGMLPALKLDGRLITESDDILIALERQFGSLNASMLEPEVIQLRKLERALFRAWCSWLCYPNDAKADAKARENFVYVVSIVEEALEKHGGPWFLGKEFSTADNVFIPYVERMSASLFYYKGYLLRDPRANPRLFAWFAALETREVYLGTQSDFATHVHDLPPQMGGCYSNNSPQALKNQKLVDGGPFLELPDALYKEPEDSSLEALAMVLKHRRNIVKVNPMADKAAFEEALRCALTALITEDERPIPPKGSDVGLRYLRDRISVPRDMSIYAARRLKTALEETASLVGKAEGPPIPTRHRRDQDPVPFGKTDSVT